MLPTFYVALLFFAILANQGVVKGDTECPAVSTVGDRRSSKSSLRLVQYNVEWLFVDYYGGSDCPGNGCTWHTISDAETHMGYVADVINDLKPDILNLCEVEGCDELHMLRDMLDPTYNVYLKKGTDTGTGQNVGLVTKVDPLVSLYRTEEKVAYPILGTKCGQTSAQGTQGVSKHYITEYRLGSMDIALIGAHLLAIPTEPSRCVQREAQAQVLQNVIYSYIQKGYEVIVMGDMNDFDAEVPDLNADKPTSRVLDFLKGLDGEKKGQYQLTNMAGKMAQNERYSDWYDSDNNCNTTSVKDYSMIDHVLISPKLTKYVGSVSIYHGYKEYCGKWNSDHYPVVIDFINL